MLDATQATKTFSKRIPKCPKCRKECDYNSRADTIQNLFFPQKMQLQFESSY